MSRLWDQGAPLDQRVLQYTAGEDYALDERLVRHDVRASIAHAQMLHAQQLLTSTDLQAIEAGLTALGAAHERGEWHIELADEDGQTALEKRLTASIASDPIEQRRTLVESARDLLRADGRVSPRERLWWLALRHRVNERQNRQAFMRPTTGQGHELLDMSLDQLNHVTALTTYMARFIPMDESSKELAPTGLTWFKGAS